MAFEAEIKKLKIEKIDELDQKLTEEFLKIDSNLFCYLIELINNNKLIKK